MNLVGINVVLTGASSGIGRELLDLLIKLECKIVATSRNIEELNIDNKNVFSKNFDLQNEKEIDDLFTYSLEKLGSIDLFIADAGYGYYEKIKKADWKHIEDIFSLNIVGLIYSALKMKDLCKDKPYNFVALGSGLSFMSLPGYSLYSSTKASIKGFADAYRFELEKEQIFQVAYPISTRTNFYLNANCPSPPKPMQDAKKVARVIVKGIKKDKREIYTSSGFHIIKNFMRILFKIPILIENKKLKKFLSNKGR